MAKNIMVPTDPEIPRYRWKKSTGKTLVKVLIVFMTVITLALIGWLFFINYRLQQSRERIYGTWINGVTKSSPIRIELSFGHQQEAFVRFYFMGSKDFLGNTYSAHSRATWKEFSPDEYEIVPNEANAPWAPFVIAKGGGHRNLNFDSLWINDMKSDALIHWRSDLVVTGEGGTFLRVDDSASNKLKEDAQLEVIGAEIHHRNFH